MAYFQILGTGPSTPITDAAGRNRRIRSSALMQHISTYVLIDVTHDFEEQVERALSVTAVVVTNASRDAAGGLGNLDRWLDTEIPFYCPADLWAEVLRRYGPFTNLKHKLLEDGVPAVESDLEVTAFSVVTSAGKKATPTYGYHFSNGKKSVVYASDVKHIPETSAGYFENNDLLVVDAAGWDKDLPTHRGALNHLHDYVAAENARIVFTHIGRAAPPHTTATAAVRRISPKAEVAYDFMKIPLGR
ncbi:MAG: phosphoribosyl 1,2-cyclic phosphodiesterase [Myxococcota bacterium]|jgi:phosphoribosyl 1,2-cyclic phosphodiesterase